MGVGFFHLSSPKNEENYEWKISKENNPVINIMSGIFKSSLRIISLYDIYIKREAKLVGKITKLLLSLLNLIKYFIKRYCIS